MSFPLYMLWRLLRSVFFIVTSPVWVPALGLVIAVGFVITHFEDWYTNVRRDWIRKQ